MNEIRTNRDLYLAIAELTGRHHSGVRDLEEYLRALREGARRYRTCSSLSPDDFFGLLCTAFTLPAGPFDEAWRSRYEDGGPRTFLNQEAKRALERLTDRPPDAGD